MPRLARSRRGSWQGRDLALAERHDEPVNCAPDATMSASERARRAIAGYRYVQII